ncbi:hypothetical protein Trydic_g17090 [Trypoxylus dichotomus]
MMPSTRLALNSRLASSVSGPDSQLLPLVLQVEMRFRHNLQTAYEFYQHLLAYKEVILAAADYIKKMARAPVSSCSCAHRREGAAGVVVMVIGGRKEDGLVSGGCWRKRTNFRDRGGKRMAATGIDSDRRSRKTPE